MGPINFSEFPPPLTLYILNCIMNCGLCSAMYIFHLVLCNDMICFFVVSINIDLTWLEFVTEYRENARKQALRNNVWSIHQFHNFTRCPFNAVPHTSTLKSLNSIWCYVNALKWLQRDITDDTSILVQLTVLCRRVTSIYLSQCRLGRSSISLYGVTRTHFVA